MSLTKSVGVVYLQMITKRDGKNVELERFSVPWRADDIPSTALTHDLFARRRHYSFPDLPQSRHGGKGRKGDGGERQRA
jgi:hypothetical protein